MKLRPHQEKALQMARDSIRKGLKRPILACPTSFGKTIVAGAMLKNCQDMGKRGWFFCDRKQLINQAIDKFRQMGIDFGVRQANHELHNPEALIQIASIQTIEAMLKHNRRLPEFDMAIIDECHSMRESYLQIMEMYNNIPIIGLTATPYSKGLGKWYNNLLVPITPSELLDKGFLCPVSYYGGEHIDLSKVRSLSANDYSPQDINSATEEDSERLAGCIVNNWLAYGEKSQTIAFSPTQNLSKKLVERFNENGISAEHIDCYTPDEERQELYEAHDNGEFKILSCSRLLNTGYDAPSVRCIIDCFPTKSVTVYVQRVGRIMRIHEGKENAIYLDHASNFKRFGYAEDIVPESLHDGERSYNEKDLIEKDKKELKTKECPSCHQQMAGYRCKACGYEVPRDEQIEIEDDGTMLVELTRKKDNCKDSKEAKEQFYSELKCHGRQKFYQDGWAYHKYQEKYGVSPRGINAYHTDTISEPTKKWITHQNIKWSKRKKK